ncbi:MAG: segregation/condensation protein A [Ignavibacteriales bacterium]|nr:segregation/condensation protein A [Ignavibacteriales bacterium]
MYNIKLQDFEGPLDLLLFFIKRDELDIYDIPIARITKEFLDYLHYIQQLDLEIAGEFLVVAAELMQIKVKLLLPPEPGQQEEADPRANLVKRLVEYKRFKEVAEAMKRQEEEAWLLHPRGYRTADEHTIVEETGEDIVRDVSFFDLIAAFKFSMDRMPRRFVHEIQRIPVTIDQQIEYIRDFFSRRSEGTFFDLCQEFEKIRIVVTFLALLEVIRSKVVIVRQAGPFGELSIMRNVN